jgi:hypothetical protein
VQTFGYTQSLRVKNKELHDNHLIPYLETHPNTTGIPLTVTVDFLSNDLASVIKKAGYRLGTHHSFGYKVRGEDTFSGTKHSLYHVPGLKSLLDHLSVTQYKTVEEQIDLGVTIFDLRLSKIGNEYVVNHGVNFGKLSDFTAAVNRSKLRNISNEKLVISIRKSKYNQSSTFDPNEAKDRIQSELQENVKSNVIIIGSTKMLYPGKDPYDPTEVLKIFENLHNVDFDSFSSYKPPQLYAVVAPTTKSMTNFSWTIGVISVACSLVAVVAARQIHTRIKIEGMDKHKIWPRGSVVDDAKTMPTKTKKYKTF